MHVLLVIIGKIRPRVLRIGVRLLNANMVVVGLERITQLILPRGRYLVGAGVSARKARTKGHRSGLLGKKV